MKSVAFFVIVSAAGSAVASPVLGNYSTYTQISADMVTAISIEEGVQGATSTLYSNIDAGSGYQSFAAATGVLGFDDYTSTTASQIQLDTFRFVGGVTTVGGIMAFEFYDSTGSVFLDGFSFAATQAGNFIYTITINTELLIDGAGIVQAVADAGTTGQWFLSNAAPTVGSEDNMFGGASGGALSHKFEINGTPIPAPGAMALLGLGGVFAGRRRR